MLNELRDLDFNDIGSAPASVRYVILGFLLAIILAIGYFLLIKDKVQQLEMVQNLENSLRAEFEQKQSKAANLENYEAQLAEMQELLETMFRQLPSRTEMDKLLVDVSQTALGSGIDVQLFQPNAEAYHDFYAERPISGAATCLAERQFRVYKHSSLDPSATVPRKPESAARRGPTRSARVTCIPAGARRSRPRPDCSNPSVRRPPSSSRTMPSSTTNRLMPWRFSGSVRATTMTRSALIPYDI